MTGPEVPCGQLQQHPPGHPCLRICQSFMGSRAHLRARAHLQVCPRTCAYGCAPAHACLHLHVSAQWFDVGSALVVRAAHQCKSGHAARGARPPLHSCLKAQPFG
eukprot:15478113-Alexandrium_andersonii.AAC.2